MQRIQYDRYGDVSQLHLADFQPVAPGEGEVLVRVVAAAANAMDWKIRRGELKFVTGRRFPRGLGHDFSGTIEQVGQGVTHLHTGDAVFGAAGMAASGAFGEAVVAEVKNLTRKPEGLSFQDAAALPIVGVTALQALDRAKISGGRSVFIHGVLGGVGQVTAQLAQLRGATVSGSCRDTASAAASALGIDAVVGFEFDPAPFANSFDLVLDTAGTLPRAAAQTLLKPGGRLIDIVPTPAKILRSVMSRKRKVLMSKMNSADLDTLGRAVANGTLHIAIARTVPLAEAVHALTKLECEHTPKGGKLIITM